MRNLFFILLSLTICGCTYHWQSQEPIAPVTYESPLYRRTDSVGKLRRLALMPVEIKSYVGFGVIKKGKLDSPKDQEAATLSYEDACAKYLTEEKGYEIALLRDVDGKWQSDLLENSENSSIQELYQEWHKEMAEKHTTSVIQKIGHALNVDGVLVIRVKERKPWGLTEGLLNIALINIPLFYNITSPNIGAWIYETATGRLVWREEYSTYGSETSTASHSLIRLFADLENAVPRQLLK